MGTVDIAVCGGGLAGLSLALQARREQPDLAVALIDARERPLPEAAFKVGEATTEIGAFYLSEHLGLGKHLEEEQQRKAGLRFFFQGGDGRFATRPELGLARRAPTASYLLDRGRLENELRERCLRAGVQLVEGGRVTDIELGEGEAPHRVHYSVGGAAAEPLLCRWVVDALGRRRLLQKRLGLARKARTGHAAAWMRVRGRVDVCDFVPASERAWHARVTEIERYHSTNHLVDAGRWIWLIPLASGHTSIGIVFSTELHAPESFRTQAAALEWLARNEPELSAALEGREILDYKRLISYSHGARRVLSERRWACTGDAAVFADPMYSPGVDLIGLGNRATLDLVRKDRQGRKLEPSEVTEQNRLLLSLNDFIMQSIQRAYPYLGNAHVMATKLVWDTAAAWSLLGPLMFGGLVTDLPARREAQKHTRRFFGLTLAMQGLFSEWAKLPARRPAFAFADPLAIPSMLEVNARNLRNDRSVEEVIEGQRADMRWLEEMAQVMFLIALEDTMPERIAELPDPLWLNAWGVTLDPARWERTRLFEPDSEPRDLAPLRREVEAVLRPEA